MPRVTELQPAQALLAAKELDVNKDESRQELRFLAHKMNIAASPEVAVSALKDKIIEILQYHNDKLVHKQAILDGKTGDDVPPMPVKPNVRVTTKDKIVPDLLESKVDHVEGEEISPEEPTVKKETKKTPPKKDE